VSLPIHRTIQEASGWEFRGLRDRKDKDATTMVDFTGQAFAEKVRSSGGNTANRSTRTQSNFAYLNGNEAVGSIFKRGAS
jgi:hypothetical protein